MTGPLRDPTRPRPDPASHLGPPRSAPLSDDHAVDLRGDALVGQHVALLVCGGIAAMKAPLTARALRRQGATVTAFMSPAAARYVTEDTLSWATERPVVTRLSAQAEHLSGRTPFSAYLLAPATYNTLNKLAVGIADTVLTSTLASALGRMAAGDAAVLVAPTMHGSMHNPVLTASLGRLRELGVRVIPPRDAYGKDNIPDEAVLVAEVAHALPSAPLRGRRAIVLGGAAADAEGRVLVQTLQDDVGQAVSIDLIHRGVSVLHLTLPTPAAASPVLDSVKAHTPAQLRRLLHDALHDGRWDLVVDATDTEDSSPPFGQAVARVRRQGSGHRVSWLGKARSRQHAVVSNCAEVVAEVRQGLLEGPWSG